MDIQDNMRQLDVTMYGKQETLTPTLSKCRVRIFYKGLNRNRTYISEDFANQLIQSLPYTPVKGIFNKEDVDFEDHGYGHNIGQIYGIVPENPNFAWESNVDPDGVTRVYACADVLIYTALYPEAKLIHEKSQSMEIHDVGLNGEWKIWPDDGMPYFEFQTGHLLGLQALGDAVEPCFEGSAFFSLYKDAKDLYDYVRNFSKKEESKEMDKNIFNLSEEDVVTTIYDAMNTEDNSVIVCSVADTYAIVYNVTTASYSKVEYSKNEENEIIVGNTEPCYIYNVTDSEKNAIEAIKADGNFADIQTKIGEYEAKIAELEEQLGAANAALEEFKKKEEEPETDNACGGKDDDDEKKKKNHELDDETEEPTAPVEPAEDFQAKVEAYESTIAEKEAEIVRLNQLNSDLSNEKSELENFKLKVDTDNKTSIINEFSAHLSEEQIADFTSRMNEFSVEDFKKEVCFAAYNSDASVIKTEDDDVTPDLIYKNTEKVTLTGALKLLNKHKGGNR